MPKVKFTTVLLFILIKYTLFYILVMFINENYTLISFYQFRSTLEFVGYFFYFSFLPFIYFALFSAILYYSFYVKNIFLFAAIFLGITIAEYFEYVYFNSQQHIDMYGVYNAIISVVLFPILFWKPIKATYLEDKVNKP